MMKAIEGNKNKTNIKGRQWKTNKKRLLKSVCGNQTQSREFEFYVEAKGQFYVDAKLSVFKNNRLWPALWKITLVVIYRLGYKRKGSDEELS